MTPDGYTEVQLLCSVFSSACFVFTVSILFTLLLSCCNVTVQKAKGWRKATFGTFDLHTGDLSHRLVSDLPVLRRHCTLIYTVVVFLSHYLTIHYLLLQAARNNVLLAVPALLYAINNYLKFIMQVIFVGFTCRVLLFYGQISRC